MESSPLNPGTSDKRERILAAALRLFDVYGFHGTSMAAIAEGAEVGAGTIYRYFESKEDLVDQLYARAREEAHAAILSMGFDEDAPVRERLQTLWKALLSDYLECPRLYRFIQKYESSAYYRQSDRSQVEDVEPRFRQIFEDGVKQDLFQDRSLAVFRSFGMGAANQLVQSHQNGEIELDDTRVEETFEMLWGAYTA